MPAAAGGRRRDDEIDVRAGGTVAGKPTSNALADDAEVEQAAELLCRDVSDHQRLGEAERQRRQIRSRADRDRRDAVDPVALRREATSRSGSARRSRDDRLR